MERILDQNGTGIVKEFPNGFDSWQETHAEICIELGSRIEKGIEPEEDGMELSRGEVWELAENLTDQFEKKYKDIAWAIDINPETKEEYYYYDELEKFLDENL